jgi:CopG antitoxin of type II toxin-antitoxin system
MTKPKESITDEGFAIVDRMDDVPPFASEAEEAEFWSTHTFNEDLLAHLLPVPEDSAGILPPARKRTSPVSVRLEHDVLYRLRRLTNRKHIGFQTLLKALPSSGFTKRKAAEPISGSRTAADALS